MAQNAYKLQLPIEKRVSQNVDSTYNICQCMYL